METLHHTVTIITVLLLCVLIVLQLRGARASNEGSSGQLMREQQVQLAALAAEVRHLQGQLTRELSTQRGELQETLRGSQQQLDTRLQASLDTNARRVQALTESNAERQDVMRNTLAQELEKLRVSNEAKLEQMRLTVDEKLQGTLEKRLGQSFTLVSARLEEVQKGLGEMQTLASDVGGLKRILTNVKSRGGWGEVQLARQLEDLLTGDQYEENVAVIPGSQERVEFALRLPGRDSDEPVYLPIDSKLPQEDYERLLDAQDAGDPEAVERAGRVLERVLLDQAKLISTKYLAPPHTTDFAIMYLPTEGLFAETVRRPGLMQRLQRDHRVTVMGPSTFGAMLTSLQMGFRTLAIEKRSSEVWQVLSAAKDEFRKYGDVWDRLSKQLTSAQNTVQEAGRRTRAVERKLRSVESFVDESAVGSSAESMIAELGAPTGGQE